VQASLSLQLAVAGSKPSAGQSAVVPVQGPIDWSPKADATSSH